MVPSSVRYGHGDISIVSVTASSHCTIYFLQYTRVFTLSKSLGPKARRLSQPVTRIYSEEWKSVENSVNLNPPFPVVAAVLLTNPVI